VPAAQTNQQAITLPMDRARHVRANFSLILVRDFVIESMGVHSSPDRNTVIAQVQIGNHGTDAWDAGLLTAWVNRSTPALCGEVGDVSIEPGILEPGESRLFVFTNLNPGVASGTRTFRAFVDARCESVETEERNNQAACNYTYLGPVLKRFTFNAVALTDSVMLRWSAPTNSGLPNNMVRLLFKTNEYPDACDDGELIYNGSLQYHHHTNRTPGASCYYGIFVNDGTYYIDPPDF
jgi:hypothetical protein